MIGVEKIRPALSQCQQDFPQIGELLMEPLVTGWENVIGFSSIYRHVSYDPALSRLYFCDARPAFEGLACFTHNPDTGGNQLMLLRTLGLLPTDYSMNFSDHCIATLCWQSGGVQSNQPKDLS